MNSEPQYEQHLRRPVSGGAAEDPPQIIPEWDALSLAIERPHKNRREFAELVADHVFGHVDGNMGCKGTLRGDRMYEFVGARHLRRPQEPGKSARLHHAGDLALARQLKGAPKD